MIADERLKPWAERTFGSVNVEGALKFILHQKRCNLRFYINRKVNGCNEIRSIKAKREAFANLPRWIKVLLFSLPPEHDRSINTFFKNTKINQKFLEAQKEEI